MERGDELKKLYEKVLENITLYNQYHNNVDYERACEISELIVKINNLAIKNGVFKGDLKSDLADFEQKLMSQERNRSVLFV